MSQIFLSLSRRLWQLWLWLCFLVCFSILFLVIFFSKLPEYRLEIEQWVSMILEQPITISDIRTYWVGGMPTIALQQVCLRNAQSQQSIVEMAHAEIGFNVLASFLGTQILTSNVTVTGTRLTLKRNHDGRITLLGLDSPQATENKSDFLGWLLQQPKVSWQSTQLTWLEPDQSPLVFSDLQLTVERQDTNHRMTGKVNLSPKINFFNEFKNLGIQAPQFKFESWLTQENFNQLKIEGQFVFNSLKLVQQSPLMSQSLQGKFQALQQANGTWQVEVKQHLVNVDQKQWLPNEVKIIVPSSDDSFSQNFLTEKNFPTDEEEEEKLEISGHIKVLSLNEFLDKLPPGFLDHAKPELREFITTLQGTLRDVKWFYWSDNTWRVHAHFVDLTSQPQQKIPGISGLSGELEITPDKGTIRFNPVAVTLNMPSPLNLPWSLTQLTGDISWQRTQTQWQVIPQLQAIDKKMEIRLIGRVNIPITGEIFESDLKVALRNGQFSQIQNYILEPFFPKIARSLRSAQLTGEVYTAQALIQNQGEQKHFEFKAQVKRVNCHLTQKVNKTIEIKNLSGYINFTPNQGTFHLDQAAITLKIPHLYSQPLSLAQLKGDINWKRAQKRWHLTTNHLQAVENKFHDEIQLEGAVNLPLQGGISDGYLQVTLHEGQLSQWQHYIPDQRWPNMRHRLSKMQLAGHLNTLQLLIKTKDKKNSFKIKGNVNNVHLNLTPGGILNNDQSDSIAITDLSGHLEIEVDKGHFHLDQATVTLNMHSWYSHPLTLSQLKGTLHWQSTQKQWHISTHQLQAFDKKMKVLMNGSIDIPQSGGMPSSNLKVTLYNGQLSQIPHYLPDIKLSKANRWFKEAQWQGNLSEANVIIQGPINSLFKSNPASHFEFKGHINQANINYAKNWPSLSQVKGKIVIKKRSLTMTVRQGQLLNSQIPKLVVKIADLSDKPLLIKLNGNARGSAVDGLRFIQQSPLHKQIDLGMLELDGEIDLQLKLVIPLSNDSKTVQGQITFNDTILHDKSFNLTLTDVAGKLHFSNDKVFAKEMRGKLLGNPINFSLLTLRNKHPKRTTVQLTGLANPQFLSRQLTQINPAFAQLSLPEHLSGTTHWMATLDFPNEKVVGNNYINIRFEADLLGMAIKLPAPLEKLAQQQRLFSLKVLLPGDSQKTIKSKNQGGKEGILLQVYYGDILNGLFRFNKKGLERGTLVLGTTSAQLPKQAILTFEGHVARLSLAAWRDVLFAKFLPKKNNNETALSQAKPYSFPILIDVNCDQLEVLGQTFVKVTLQAKYTELLWQLAITGTGIEGHITFNPFKNTPLLDLSFKEITLTVPKAKARTSNSFQKVFNKPPNPRYLPQLSFHCDDLEIGDMNLGRVTLHTHPHPDGLEIELEALDIGFHFQAQGQWRYVAQRHQTRLQAQLISEKLGLMLHQLGYQNSPIIGGRSQIALNTYWSGAPYQFELARLVGTLSLVIMEGSIIDVEPGAVGRLFGLFDLYTLPKRLTLDFNDVFNKGLGFNTIAGVFFVKDGSARTDHLILQGPAARVEISGSTHLVNKYYDQIVTVFPQFSNPLPVAGALAGGVGIGAAALVVQQLLQGELEKVIHSQYRITGAWDKPEIVPLHSQTTRNEIEMD